MDHHHHKMWFCLVHTTRTRYGKGVYFAQHASYSANPVYAKDGPDGLCRMFLCRVAHGLYCVGSDNALTPDVLDAKTHRLYNSTVDNVANPNMWVTYHDGQAYPEYLVYFRKRDQGI
jgi:poly [ADP-ribose] polymerase 10/14/15